MSDKPTEPTMTPRELLALADRLEKSAQAQLERARQIRDAVATIQRLGAMGSEDRTSEDAHTASRPAFPGPLHGTPPGSEKTSLRSRGEYDTLATMNTSTIDTRPAVPGRKFTSKHPLTTKAKTLKMSIKDVAEALSKKLKRTIPRTTVRSWYAPRDSGDGRPIPADAVKVFEADPWNIPRDAWKNGISE